MIGCVMSALHKRSLAQYYFSGMTSHLLALWQIYDQNDYTFKKIILKKSHI